jgi:hypothetical protein
MKFKFELFETTLDFLYFGGDLLFQRTVTLTNG